MSQNVSGAGLCLSSKDYFTQMVRDAFEDRQIKTFPLAQNYLVGVLEFHLVTDNLFDEVDSSGRKTKSTLAESFLKASSSEPATRVELLKKLADRSLYVSGFFGDSLQRKIVDVDYYADMGGTAYAALADCVREDTFSKLYREYAKRFLEFAEVLNHISSKAHLRDEQNIMRLFESYTLTGSEIAREKLLEKGLIAVPRTQASTKKQ